MNTIANPSAHWGGIRKGKKMPLAQRCVQMIELAQRRLAEVYRREDARALAELELRHWRLQLIRHEHRKVKNRAKNDNLPK